jgi:hypothetical protein
VSKSSARESGVPSPYVSLRQAVRPAIFAYSILSTERERAGALAEECNNLLRLSRELMKSALAHVLIPEPGQRMPVIGDNSAAERQARLLDAYAYADVGLLWARVVGSCMAIADVILERGEWAKVHHLSDVLSDVGETTSAKEPSRRAKDGPIELAKRRLRNVHETMSVAEVRDALNILGGLRSTCPDRGRTITAALPSICMSMPRLVPPGSGTGGLHQCDFVRRNDCNPDMANYFFAHVTGEFARLHAMKGTG